MEINNQFWTSSSKSLNINFDALWKFVKIEHCCSWIFFIRSSLFKQFLLFLLLCWHSSFNKFFFSSWIESSQLGKVDSVQSPLLSFLSSYSVILWRRVEFSFLSLSAELVTSLSLASNYSFSLFPTMTCSRREMIYSYFLLTYSSNILTFSSNCSQI